jgi:hypothetical protein
MMAEAIAEVDSDHASANWPLLSRTRVGGSFLLLSGGRGR